MKVIPASATNERKSFLNSPIRFAVLMAGYACLGAASWFFLPSALSPTNWKVVIGLFCLGFFCDLIGTGKIGGGEGTAVKVDLRLTAEIGFVSRRLWIYFLFLVGGSFAIYFCRGFLPSDWKVLIPRFPIFLLSAAYTAWRAIKMLFAAQQKDRG